MPRSYLTILLVLAIFFVATSDHGSEASRNTSLYFKLQSCIDEYGPICPDLPGRVRRCLKVGTYSRRSVHCIRAIDCRKKEGTFRECCRKIVGTTWDD